MPLFIIIPITAWLVAMIIRVLLAVLLKKGIIFSDIWSYGGTPSLHSSLLVSLTTVIFLQEGFSAALAVSLFLTVIIIFDALNLRRFVGQQGQVLNKLIKVLPAEQEYVYPILATKVGHRFKEVVAGIVVGAAVAWLGWLMLGN